MSAAFPAQLAKPDNTHIVRFYEEDSTLLGDVREFADEALRCGGSAILIATEEHLAGLVPLLRGLGPGRDERPWFTGNLITLPAQQTLDGFMVDGWPDEQRFLATVGKLVAAEAQRATPLHAFGEMVALLCEQGLYDAALRLEAMWNDLIRRHGFKLLCAYPHRVFSNAEQAQHFRCVCAAHTHFYASTAGSTSEIEDTSLRAAVWQQKALALENEVKRLRHAEATLRRREFELIDFLDNAAEGLHRVASDGTILWANAAELKLLGYSYDEYVGRPITDFHVDADVIESILNTLKAGETLYDRPARLRCKDGTIKHVVIHSNGCFEDGELRYTRCFTRDASDRVARETAEQQRDAVLMHAPVAAALLTGPDHVFQLVNQRYGEWMGRTALVGRALADVFPELRDSELMSWLDRVYRNGEPFTIDEYYLGGFTAAANGDADGAQARYLQIHAQPLRARDGAIEGIIAIAIDVTTQVRDRQRLEKSHTERERLLRELERASQAKDEFLAMLGHELRNPLSPIVTALQLMRMRGSTGTEREQGIIERQVDHLVRLIDDLLDVSRITRGNIELKIESVRIADVLTKAIEMASRLLEQRSHRLTIDVDRTLVWQGDPVRLAQAVANLLTNAARYTDIGGQIDLSARRDEDGAIVIQVCDNGIGIPAEMLPDLFNLFFQGPRRIDRQEGGLGIGLALVKNLVELHGGSVAVASEGPGRGSAFTIRLPMTTPETAAGTAALRDAGLAVVPGHTRRVLLVDDNVDSVQALAQLLKAYGHLVEVVYDPVSALRVVEHFAPDVAVLDIGLPVMDGYELVRRLREVLDGRPCRFVALTGYGQDADRDRSRAAGFGQHLVKPVSPEALLRLIQETGH